jgi:threonine dehydrogenase-like Zn-dependent dehydrogenase
MDSLSTAFTAPLATPRPDSMQALVRTDAGPALVTRPLPRRQPGEALIQVLLTGICRTDLFAADGQLPVAPLRVLGHETAGLVAEADRDAPLRPGQRVAIHPILACGGCRPCLAGHACSRPRMLGLDEDGAFAGWMVVPASAVWPVPDALSLERVAYVEPVAAALAVLRAPIDRARRGLVVGTNRIAQLTLRVLAAHGFRGVSQIAAGDPVDEDAFDWAIETLATAETMEALLRAVRPGGVVVLKSRPAGRVPLDLARAVRKDLSLHAVSYAPFADAIDLLGRLEVDDLLGERAPLADFREVFARARADESRKLFLAPPAGEAR